MKPLETVRTLQQHFSATFTEASVVFDNAPISDQNSAFVHFSVQVGESQPNLDSTFVRTVGVAFAVIKVPKGLGDLVAWDLAEKAAAVLELRTVGSIRLTSAGFLNAGIVGDSLQEDSGWYQINVTVPFWFEHYVT